MVLILLSILAIFSVSKFIDLGENAKMKALEAAVAELNGRENLVWLDTKYSDVGWIDDATLFAQMDCDLGSSYQWKSSAEIDGGNLYFKNKEAKLDRSSSTAIFPCRWEMKIEKDKKRQKEIMYVSI